MRALTILLAFSLLLPGCGSSRSSNDGTFTRIQLPSSVNQTETGNPIVKNASISFSAYDVSTPVFTTAAVSAVQICLKRIRFRLDDADNDGIDDDDRDDNDGDGDGIPDSEDEDDDDISLDDIGYLTLAQNGTPLEGIDVPSGTYDRIEFDIESNCDGQGSPAMSVDNDNDGGTPFTTEESMKLRFRGRFDLTEKSNVLLTIGNLINNLDDVEEADDIKDIVEDMSSEGEIGDDDD